MTDPGLTDLIAAEVLQHRGFRPPSAHQWRCSCKWLGRDFERHVAERIASVVEQHANGRITELEAELAQQMKVNDLMAKMLQLDALNTVDELRAALEGEQQ